ncbi:hypothetical protein AB0I60_32185 [Actinosynnema sp. NPDC050436]|uniref:hypothetical protein n=1 Tax=Actinosynnema sp. NPDC050436 TaxID=3155659 RepID=UPI0033EEE878
MATAEKDPSYFNQDAVAAVYADYCFELGELKERQQQAYLQSRHGHKGKRIFHQKIDRALEGQPLTLETLRRLCAAFGFSEFHRSRSERIWHGEEYGPVIEGKLERPDDLPAPEHETVSVDEDHHIGADGLPAHHEVRQTILSHVDGLAYFPYRFNTDRIDVALTYGGVQGGILPYGNSLWEVRFLFHKPIPLGATAHLQYRQSFRYVEPPAPEYRRCVYNRYNGWNVRVHFHPDRIPEQVWWAEWDGRDGDSLVLCQDPVEIDGDRSVHRSLRSVERACAGFMWKW